MNNAIKTISDVIDSEKYHNNWRRIEARMAKKYPDLDLVKRISAIAYFKRFLTLKVLEKVLEYHYHHYHYHHYHQPKTWVCQLHQVLIDLIWSGTLVQTFPYNFLLLMEINCPVVCAHSIVFVIIITISSLIITTTKAFINNTKDIATVTELVKSCKPIMISIITLPIMIMTIQWWNDYQTTSKYFITIQ